MGSDAMVNMPSYIKMGSNIQKKTVRDTQRHTQSMVIAPTLFYQNKEVG
jgi:hypothetical protein